MITPIFQGIQEEIRKQLQQAHTSIDVAVAWFTDNSLFELLLQKAKSGLKIRVMLVKDGINEAYLPFDVLKSAGAEVIFISESETGTLMHNKFCVIDHQIILSGSYNWTLKAARSSGENIIITDEELVVAQYQAQFEKLWTHLAKQKSPHTELNVLLSRCKMLKEALLSQDAEEVKYQATRLKTVWIHAENSWKEGFEYLWELLDKELYHSALELLEKRITAFSQITVYESNELFLLRLKISGIEKEIALTETTLSESESLLADYRRELVLRFGTLFRELLELKTKLAEKRAKATQKDEYEAEYEQRKQEKEDFDKEEKVAKNTPQLSEEDKKELKRSFKKAAMMCHSDKLQGENEEFTKKANEIFSELNEAYHQKNLKRVKEILRDLENGKAFESVFSKSLMDDVEKMKRRFMELLEKLKVLQKKLYELLESEEYKKVVQISDRENHFLTVKESLETQIKQLKKEIKAFGD
jgi:hypothetical protein